MSENQVDKEKLIEHLELCSRMSKDQNVTQVIINLKQDVEAGHFDSGKD
jgi:hypothetical protein